MIANKANLVVFNVILGLFSSSACQVSNNAGILLTRTIIRRADYKVIQPGTKWCGAGSVADSFDDLGYERETDKCCRDHDFCPDLIAAGDTKYNITNEAFYTRLSCKCDEQFRECLRATKKRSASNIGTVYFNALGTQCFRDDYPTISCVRRGGWLKRKCLEYAYNTTEPKRYQWFDVIEY